MTSKKFKYVVVHFQPEKLKPFHDLRKKGATQLTFAEFVRTAYDKYIRAMRASEKRLE